MPNWVEGKLKIRGKPEDIKRWVEECLHCYTTNWLGDGAHTELVKGAVRFERGHDLHPAECYLLPEEKQMNLPDKKYAVIYADPPWSYRQCGTGPKSRGNAAQHYNTMTTDDICALPVKNLAGGSVCFMWATFPQIADALRVMEAWGFKYKTCAFVWIKKNRKSNTNFWGMGAYTRANAEICLLGVTPGFKPAAQIKNHAVHQVIESPVEEHSKKPEETRRRIVELLGDVPRIELFARQRSPGWDAWGNEIGEQDEK